MTPAPCGIRHVTEDYLPKILSALKPFLAVWCVFPMQNPKYVMNCRIMRPKDSQVIIIPARMAASRLPGKPLADIAGKPMIQHVWERARAANIAPVYVATDHQEIADVIHAAGGQAVITRADHPSGSDRVFEAIQAIDPDGRFEVVLNLQGDLPEMDITIPATLATALSTSTADLATLVTPANSDEAARPQVVKAVVAWNRNDTNDTIAKPGRFGRALYFSRAAVPTGTHEYLHHIGVYGWRRDALARFVALPPSPLELAEKLEQLRALEAGMSIAIAMVDSAPGGVDTDEDLANTRRRLGHN